jgi:hypothetical protein
MKKCFIIAICLCSILAFARSPHHGWHRHHRGGDGVWLAAGITGIVANSINILNAVTTPRYVVPAPVSAPPVIVPQTVYPQVAPAAQIVYPQTSAGVSHYYYEQKIPVIQTIFVPIQINGQTVYRQEQRIIYIKQGK